MWSVVVFHLGLWICFLFVGVPANEQWPLGLLAQKRKLGTVKVTTTSETWSKTSGDAADVEEGSSGDPAAADSAKSRGKEQMMTSIDRPKMMYKICKLNFSKSTMGHTYCSTCLLHSSCTIATRSSCKAVYVYDQLVLLLLVSNSMS